MLAKDAERLRQITTDNLSRELADKVWEIIDRADLVDISDEDSQPEDWTQDESARRFDGGTIKDFQQEPGQPSILPRGKYAGRSHASVVAADPNYVEWLHDNDKAAGLGFTAEHIEEAKILLSDLKKSKPRYTAPVRGPWNR